MRRIRSNDSTTTRRYLLKLTPIEARELLGAESGKSRHPYCTMVLLDGEMHEIKGEKQRTPALKGESPCWSPLKAELLRSSTQSSHTPLGLEAAAAAEEYTFGKTCDVRQAKYLLVKCKDKSLVETEDLGRLLLSLEDLDTSGHERVAWYSLQLRPGGKMKHVRGQIQVSSRIVREPSRWQLWSCAKQMLSELDIRDRSFYLKLHVQCFTGKEAVEWMLRHGPQRSTDGGITIATEEEAILLGNCMIRAFIFTHVTGDSKRPFVNSARQLYRFSVHHKDIAKQNKALDEMTRVLAKLDLEEDENLLVTRTMSARECSATTPALPPTPLESQPSTPLPPPDKLAKAQQKPVLKIQDFELLKVLGTGTYGRVLSARGPNGEIYAMKIVSKIGMDDLMRRNAKIERDVLREIDHPFVATLSFAFQNEDKLYMGMEFFNGGDLRHHLSLHSRGELELTHQRIQFYAAELVAGIAHIHSLDIIYRDLKPENILLAKDGHIRLVDFGLSKLGVKSGDRANTLAGSPDYVAPEVLASASAVASASSSNAGYDKTCDWWSLGILIFEMYIGRTPFKDANTSVMYRNIQEGHLYLPPDLADATKSLLAGLIRKDPKSRFGAGEEVPFTIMNHPYFEGIDWEKLQAKEIAPPWIPDVVDDTDVKYIDTEFTEQVPTDTPEWRMLDSVDRAREHFQDFTYQPTHFTSN